MKNSFMAHKKYLWPVTFYLFHLSLADIAKYLFQTPPLVCSYWYFPIPTRL